MSGGYHYASTSINHSPECCDAASIAPGLPRAAARTPRVAGTELHVPCQPDIIEEEHALRLPSPRRRGSLILLSFLYNRPHLRRLGRSGRAQFLAARPNAWSVRKTGVERAAIVLSGIEMVHMMRKRRARYAFNPNPPLAEQFEILVP